MEDQCSKVNVEASTGTSARSFELLVAMADPRPTSRRIIRRHYSPNDTTILLLLPFLEDKNVGILNAYPVSPGLMTNQGTPDWHPAPGVTKRMGLEVAAYCRKRISDISKHAIQLALPCRSQRQSLF